MSTVEVGDKVWVYTESFLPFPATVERVGAWTVLIDGFTYFQTTQNRVDGYPGLFRTQEQRQDFEQRFTLFDRLRRHHVEFKPGIGDSWSTSDLQLLVAAVDHIKGRAR